MKNVFFLFLFGFSLPIHGNNLNVNTLIRLDLRYAATSHIVGVYYLRFITYFENKTLKIII